MAPTSAASYPTLGFDPSPGDLYEVERLSGTLRRSYEAMNEISNVLRGADEGEWRGSAAIQFRKLLDDEAKNKIDDATRAFEKAYRAVDTWGRSLDTYQSRSAGYERLAAAAAEDLADAQRSLGALPDAPPPGADPPEDSEQRDEQERDAQSRARFGTALTEAQDRLDRHVANARSMRDEEYDPEGNRLAGQLGAAIEIAPPEPGWFSSALDFLGDIVDSIGDGLAWAVDKALEGLEKIAPLLSAIGELAGTLAAVLGVLSLFIPGLAGIVAILAIVAFASNYLAAAGESGSFVQPLSTSEFWLDAAGVALSVTGVGLARQAKNLATPSFFALFRSGTTMSSAQGLNFMGSYKVWQAGIGQGAASGGFSVPTELFDIATGNASATQKTSVVA